MAAVGRSWNDLLPARRLRARRGSISHGQRASARRRMDESDGRKDRARRRHQSNLRFPLEPNLPVDERSVDSQQRAATLARVGRGALMRNRYRAMLLSCNVVFHLTYLATDFIH